MVDPVAITSVVANKLLSGPFHCFAQPLEGIENATVIFVLTDDGGARWAYSTDDRECHSEYWPQIAKLRAWTAIQEMIEAVRRKGASEKSLTPPPHPVA